MRKLVEIVGEENFTATLEELVPYSYDARACTTSGMTSYGYRRLRFAAKEAA